MILHEPAPPRGLVVAACSSAAFAAGVRPGQPLAEATALCSPHSEPRDEHTERQDLLGLAEFCEQFSPLVGVAAAGDSLLLDVTGIGSLFGGEERLEAQIRLAFQRRRLHPQIALADTIGAAWALAHFPAPGATAFPALPVEALRLPDETVVLLRQLGIERIEQLARLPRAALAARFGPQLLLRWDQATGAVAELLDVHRVPPRYETQTRFEFPTAQRPAIETALRELADRLAALLRARGQGAVRLEGRLDCVPDEFADDVAGQAESLLLRLGLFQPTADPEHWLELLRLQLDPLRLPGPVEQITLLAALTAPVVPRQRELFASEPQTPRELAFLIDRLSNRLGRESVVRPRLQADALPERACRYVSLTGVKPAGKRRRVRVDEGEIRRPLPRPLQLLSPPRRLDALQRDDAQGPGEFHDGQRAQRVLRHWGPERIETGWWRGRTARRDYFRVQTETGQRFWLYRDLDTDTWFLHGEFA